MNKLPITALIHNCKKDRIEILRLALASMWFCTQKLFIADNSTKESIELAEKFGCEVHEYKGEKSFSKRRNFGISKASNDLMLQCDSDEVFEWDAYHKIKQVMNHEKFDECVCYLFILNNYDIDSGNLQSKSPLERMYRKGTYFEKDVQNKIVFDGQRMQTDIRFDHYGYSSKTHPLKQWHRIPANEEAVRENPDDMHARMYLINALVVAGAGNPFMYDRVLAHSEICIDQYKKDKSDTNKYILQKVLRFLYVISASVNNHKGFLEIAKPIITAVLFHPDSHLFMFDSYRVTQDFDNCVKWGKSFIKALDDFPKTGLVLEITTAHERERVVKTIEEIERMNDGSANTPTRP
jgi:glycosyltransferase involved in cell wall biosynthesis